jgi:hypothetical protein
MEINDWWAGLESERYWMEITDRDDPGTDLSAPQLNGAGRPEWSYTLVTETRPGDIVLHWHRNWIGRAALVGWSEVTGPLSIENSYRWMAHGTRGRARGVPTVGHGWRMECGGFNSLPQPIDAAELAQHESTLRAVRQSLEASTKGSVYFPFVVYRPGEIRAAQAYLTKFPAALVAALPGLAAALAMSPPKDASAPSRRKRTTSQLGSGQRRLQDSKLRLAIERHAVEVAKQYYLGLGATKVEELGKPYDLRVLGLGPERHVEVKGSSKQAATVELTVNEVTHAHNHRATDLVVVDEIDVQKDENGEYKTSGGYTRIWSDWKPNNNDLAPTQFLYVLPIDAG